MTREDILNDIKTIFNDVLDKENIVLKESSTANDVDDWDSLSNIQIIVEIEKKFNIRFSSTEINEWNNVGQIINSVDKLMK